MKTLKNKFLIPVLTFLLTLSIIIFARKLFGNSYRLNYLPATPYTWKEIFDNMFEYVITSIIASSFISYFLFKGIKEKKVKHEQEINLYNKLINEREQNKIGYDIHECRVCDHYSEKPTWGDDGVTPSFELCDCCGAQFGKNDVSHEIINEYRNKWISKGGKWFNTKNKPKNWSFEEQKSKFKKENA